MNQGGTAGKQFICPSLTEVSLSGTVFFVVRAKVGTNKSKAVDGKTGGQGGEKMIGEVIVRVAVIKEGQNWEEKYRGAES